MSFDGIFLYLTKNEIEQALLGNRVDKIYQPSKEELLFTFRTPQGIKKLLLSARADSARIQLTQQVAENPKKPPMLTMLLRKHLCGARLTEIRQEGFERILTLVFDARNELGDAVVFYMIIEIMGRYSNIIFTDAQQRIIECVKRIDEQKSSVREILPGLPYVLPPQQDKMNLLTDDITALKTALQTQKPQAVLQGISPIVARELSGYADIADLRRYIAQPTPCAVILDKPKDFTFFVPRQFEGLCELKTFATFSELIDYFYYEQVKIERIRQRSHDLFKHLTTLEERALRKAIHREKELEDCRDKEKFRMWGDLINAHLHTLEKGALFYHVENFYAENAPERIPADPLLTPAQNAQKYYKEYRKKQVAESKLKDFIREAEEEAYYLDSVIDALSRAETDSEISAIREELSAAGFLRRSAVRKERAKKLAPRQFRSSDGFMIYVGRNNLQNDELTLKTAKNYDMWFHVKDAAGCHVIAVAEKERPFTDALIRQAAMLAVEHSKAKGSSNVAVDYTIVKNVHKPNGAKPGMVIYDRYRTEYVTPNEAELKEIINLE